ncbi:MAG TPA: hypothetical protein DIU04_05575, partial [Pseudomonas sp.]|nr:hypothetical protein [Pseudomonas sp.]
CGCSAGHGFVQRFLRGFGGKRKCTDLRLQFRCVVSFQLLLRLSQGDIGHAGFDFELLLHIAEPGGLAGRRGVTRWSAGAGFSLCGLGLGLGFGGAL